MLTRQDDDQQHHEKGFPNQKTLSRLLLRWETHLLTPPLSSLRLTLGMSLIILLSTQSAQCRHWQGAE